VQWSRSLRRTFVAALAVGAAARCSGSSNRLPSSPSPFTAPAVIVGAGDIAVCGSPGTRETARLLDATPGVVFTTGDHAYPSGSAEEFERCYDPFWGRHRSRTRPSPGNHDYVQPGAEPYFDYFGDQAGPRGLGYYTYTVGQWRLYALNSNVPLGPGSEQLGWLEAEVRRGGTRCALAYWHHPLFTSGPHPEATELRALWRVLYEGGVDVVLNGHDHAYERFAPQDPDGRADPARGIRQFVVGTGGASLYRGGGIRRPTSEVREPVWGVLKLILDADRYHWEFLSVPGEPFRDSGTGVCH
jgi:hypothetical protein